MKTRYAPAIAGLLLLAGLGIRGVAAPPPGELARNSLTNTHWELVIPVWKLGTKAKLPVLDFTADRVSASVGCNRLGGAYKLKGMAITIAPLISTKMSCGPDLDRAEGEYGNALQEATQWQLSRDGQTLLLQGKTKAYVFRKSTGRETKK